MPRAGETLGPFELLERLPARDGSTSEAFTATDTRTGSPVVVEVLRETATSVEKARFGLRGRRLLALRHPALATPLEAKPTYGVFEAIAPLTLRSQAGLAIARARQKLSFVAQLAAALALLHKHGVVHDAMTLDAASFDVGKVKLLVTFGADLSGSPLDDVRGLAIAACELVLGQGDVGGVEARVAERLHEAGLPAEAAAILARACGGASLTSEDLAQKLSLFAEFTGPGTEPLLPVARRSSPD